MGFFVPLAVTAITLSYVKSLNEGREYLRMLLKTHNATTS